MKVASFLHLWEGATHASPSFGLLLLEEQETVAATNFVTFVTSTPQKSGLLSTSNLGILP